MTIGRIPSVEGGIQPTIVDAKGDLIAATAADTVNRLAVGDNDQILVADSSTSTGLAWKSNATPFAAGKNKIINGDFGIWQRGSSFSPATSDTYTADRWFQNSGNNTDNFITRQTFTPGTAPVAGYEGEYYLRWVTNPAGSGGTFKNLTQRVEDVRTLSGQTVTLSFWAKADAARDVSTLLQQNFGSGGSASVNTSGTTFTLTTSWVRYSTTVTLPSVAGKTIGSSSFLRVNFGLPLNTAFTIEFWGVQLEAGSVATPFQTATGTLQGELAACQRYYQRFSQTVNLGNFFQDSGAKSTTKVGFAFPSYVQFRAIPGSLETANVGVYQYANATSYTSGTWTYLGYGPNNQTLIDYTHGSAVFTANNVCALVTTSAGSLGYIGLSAEL
jgi:hypothetical protein